MRDIKPTHKPIKNFYAELKQYENLGATNETEIRLAFATLLQHYARQNNLTLICEKSLRTPQGNIIYIDGMLTDNDFGLPRGYWEAKDLHDNLTIAVIQKFDAGYPQDNILFTTQERAILYQDGQEVMDVGIADPEAFIRVLHVFFSYEQADIANWERAAVEFKDKVPALGQRAAVLIQKEEDTNARFQTAFTDFHRHCQETINPNLAKAAVEEMLTQHLLTEEIFSTVFDNRDFTRRNIIAREIENVIDTLTERAYNRAEFLRELSPFYGAIQGAAATFIDFSQKQHFLNTVYEQFFQGFSVKVADTHGIVYTPQPIVNFMVKSISHLLETEFGRSLSDSGVHLIDPFVGTGNFIVRLIQEIDKTALKAKYRDELHCNEVLLMPYYIASMNIEHEFYVATKQYQPFENLCLVDTFDLTAERQLSMFAPENTRRIERQKQTEMFVVIGNPPYNDDFVVYDHEKISWSSGLKQKLMGGYIAEFTPERVRKTLYRPFTKSRFYFDRFMVERVYVFPSIFPTPETEAGNRVICVNISQEKPFTCLIANCTPEHIMTGGFGSAGQYFPLAHVKSKCYFLKLC